MKHGLKPNRHQVQAIKWAGLTPSEWLIVKNLSGKLLIIHRYTGQTKEVPNE